MSLLSQAIARRNKINRYERKWAKRWREVIASQLEAFKRAVAENPYVASETVGLYIRTDEVKRAYRAMIMDTGEAFRLRNPEKVIKAISDDNWITLVTNYVEQYGGFFIEEVNNFTKDYVLLRLQPILGRATREGLSIQDTAKLIQEDIGEYQGKFARYRATRIARTEIIGTANWASVESVKAEGLEGLVLKKWYPELDGRERTTHRAMMDKEPIPVLEPFEVPRADGGIDLMQYPGDKNGSGGNIINCRCTVVYERIQP
jgi:hypothetical protein